MSLLTRTAGRAIHDLITMWGAVEVLRVKQSTVCFWALSQICEKRLLASSCLCVRPTARMNQLGSLCTDVHEIRYLRIFIKVCREIQVSLKSDKIKRDLTWRKIYILIISRTFRYRMKNVSITFVEKIKTHILRSVIFFPPENRAVYEIMWKKYCRQYGACKMHAGYVRLQIHSGCFILISFPLQQWLHERASILRYTTLPVFLCYRLVSTLREYLPTNSCNGYWLYG